MITFFLLIIAMMGLASIGVFITAIYGCAFFVIFGDIIICVLIILGLIKLFGKKD